MTDATTSPDAENVPVPTPQETLDALEERLHSTASQETLNALKERLHSTTERLETRISTIHTRIHRFPHHLIGIGGVDKRYVVPSVVAIGPYHHGQPHLQKMEEVKHAAAYMVCMDSGHTVDEVYAKVISVAGDARCCYDDDDASLASVSDAEFVTMMFLDGCFLVWYIAGSSGGADNALRRRCYYSSGFNIMKDMFLLENQIPWVVLEALMEFRPLTRLDHWTRDIVGNFFYREEEKVRPWIVRLLQVLQMRCRRGLGKQRDATVETSIVNDGDYYNKAPHLLGLLRSRTIRGMPPQKSSGKAGKRLLIKSRGAVDLAQIGVKITASRAEWFADMNVHKKLVSGELSLSPLGLGPINACRLVNMAALEATGAFATASSTGPPSDGYVVSSYLSTMAMLMDWEEDVHELRRSGVLSSKFSNAETLTFFKGIGQNLRPGNNYYNTLWQIDGYIRRRPVRIALYKFFYNNYRTIAAVLSIAGVLASVLKALYSLKKP